MEREYESNLREYEEMQEALGEIREKYRLLGKEKNSIQERYNDVLGENEELTCVINHLKGEVS